MLGRIRVVLVRPRRGGNVGSVARAMKNMGLENLVLVAPRTPCGAVAARMAAHAADVLASRRTVADLQAAVADCHLVIGTVGRATTGPDAARAPRELAPEIIAAARRGRVALVFGPEDHGLSNTDLALCQRRLRIPTHPAYPSLNLAQAVALCAYEIHLAASDGVAERTRAGRERRAEADSTPATSREREALLAHLAQALERIGFLSRQNPVHILRDVGSLFARSGLTTRDVRIWRGIARQVLWAVGARSGKPAGPRARSRRG